MTFAGTNAIALAAELLATIKGVPDVARPLSIAISGSAAGALASLLPEANSVMTPAASATCLSAIQRLVALQGLVAGSTQYADPGARGFGAPLVSRSSPTSLAPNGSAFKPPTPPPASPRLSQLPPSGGSRSSPPRGNTTPPGASAPFGAPLQPYLMAAAPGAGAAPALQPYLQPSPLPSKLSSPAVGGGLGG